MLKVIKIRDSLSLLSDSRFFPLTQDSVLLADFAAPRLHGRGLDLGAGQGFLSVLTMMRAQNIELEGLELLPGAAAMADSNLKQAGFPVPVITGDLRRLPQHMNGRYDFCICNPPYFEASRGAVSPKNELGLARSDQGASIQDVCFAAHRLLKPGGKLFLCFPSDRLAALFAALEPMKLMPKRMRMVQENAASNAALVLLEARNQGGEGLNVLPPLVLREPSGEYSAEYLRIYDGKPPRRAPVGTVRRERNLSKSGE